MVQLILKFQSRSLEYSLITALFFTLLALPLLTYAQQSEKKPISAESTAIHTTQPVENQKNGEEKKEGEHGNVIAHILEHKVANSSYIDEYPFPKINLPQFEPITLAGVKIDLSFSRHLMYLWISAIITFLMLWGAARKNKNRHVPKGFGNMIEAIIVFVRDEIALPVLGHNAKKHLPILLTFFFFIATTNLLGLLPWSATSTGNINVTATLAIISFCMMIGGGMSHNGIFGYFRGLIPHGVPVALFPLMFVIEVIGLFTKPFALSVRLFANMLSGGLVIGAFYGLIFGLQSFAIAPVSLAFLLFMTLLKMFVCLLQAYIFTMLSAFFLGMAVHQEH